MTGRTRAAAKSSNGVSSPAQELQAGPLSPARHLPVDRTDKALLHRQGQLLNAQLRAREQFIAALGQLGAFLEEGHRLFQWHVLALQSLDDLLQSGQRFL